MHLKYRLNSAAVSQQALIQLEQPGDCFPFLLSISHKLAFFHLAMLKCPCATFDESPDVEFWRDQTCLYEKHQWLRLWGVGECESSEQGNPPQKCDKNCELGISILQINYTDYTIPKANILPEIRRLENNLPFENSPFLTHAALQLDIEILGLGMSSISGIHWAFEVFS